MKPFLLRSICIYIYYST